MLDWLVVVNVLLVRDQASLADVIALSSIFARFLAVFVQFAQEPGCKRMLLDVGHGVFCCSCPPS